MLRCLNNDLETALELIFCGIFIFMTERCCHQLNRNQEQVIFWYVPIFAYHICKGGGKDSDNVSISTTT